MVTDQQVRRLFKLVQTEKNFGIATIKAEMDEKTARKYHKLGKQWMKRLPASITSWVSCPVNWSNHTHGGRAKIHLRTAGMV